MENEPYNGIDRTKVVKPEAIAGLRHLFVNELRNAFANENALSLALPELAACAKDESLKITIDQQHVLACAHQKKLEHIFYLIGETIHEGDCLAVAHLLRRGIKNNREDVYKSISDTATIIILFQIDHLRIGLYGSLCSLAKTLGKNDVTDMLHEILVRIKGTNESLSEIIESLELRMLDKYSE